MADYPPLPDDMTPHERVDYDFIMTCMHKKVARGIYQARDNAAARWAAVPTRSATTVHSACLQRFVHLFSEALANSSREQQPRTLGDIFDFLGALKEAMPGGGGAWDEVAAYSIHAYLEYRFGAEGPKPSSTEDDNEVVAWAAVHRFVFMAYEKGVMPVSWWVIEQALRTLDAFCRLHFEEHVHSLCTLEMVSTWLVREPQLPYNCYTTGANAGDWGVLFVRIVQAAGIARQRGREDVVGQTEAALNVMGRERGCQGRVCVRVDGADPMWAEMERCWREGRSLPSISDYWAMMPTKAP